MLDGIHRISVTDFASIDLGVVSCYILSEVCASCSLEKQEG